MKYRVNYLNIVKDNMRSQSLILEARDEKHAREAAETALQQREGQDNFRITTIKPW